MDVTAYLASDFAHERRCRQWMDRVTLAFGDAVMHESDPDRLAELTLCYKRQRAAFGRGEYWRLNWPGVGRCK